MSEIPTTIDFRANVQRTRPDLPKSVKKATAKFLGTRAGVVGEFGQARWQTLRQAGHDLRLHTLEHLDHYLLQLEAQVTAAGWPLPM